MRTSRKTRHPKPRTMTTNYTVAIAHHANWIWDQLNTNSTVSTDTFAWVAADLESAETCADEYRFQEAVGFILGAARQVFGVYSETYAGLVRFYS
jgi:hypothetical protein